MEETAKPILNKKGDDAMEHKPGRVRRASAVTRTIAYLVARKPLPMPSVITTVITLDKNPGIEKLRKVVCDRLTEMPRFRSKMVFGKGPCYWEEVETIDIGYHCEVYGFEKKVTNLEVEDIVAKSRDRLWHIDKPLWRIIHVPEMEDGSSKLITFIDHTIGDGISLVNALLFRIIDEGRDLAEKADTAAVQRRSKKPQLPLRRRLGAYAHGIYAGHTAVFWRQDKKNGLKLVGDPSGEKVVGSSEKIELAKIKEIARKVGKDVTVNDVIMAVLTKQIAMYFAEVNKEHPEKIKERKMRAQIIVDTRRGKSNAADFEDPNNNWAASTFGLPVSSYQKNAELVLAMKQKIDLVKCSPQPFIAAKAPGRLLPILPLGFVLDVAINSVNIATCVLSNVPGPQQEVHLAGAAITNMEFYLFSAVGFYVGIFSYNGSVSCTVNIDKKIGADQHLLCRLFPIAFQELYDGICGADAKGAPGGSPTTKAQEASLSKETTPAKPAAPATDA